jgi:hypothetical protein
MLGPCTRTRKYVDWEIQASLRQGATMTPNGLMGIRLPTYQWNVSGYPDRLNANLLPWERIGIDECYARAYPWPSNAEELGAWIDDAYNARTWRAHLINNSRDRYTYNKWCGHAH